MNRSWSFVALCGLALASAGAPTGALAVEPDELAAPGVCATESRELRQGPVTSEAGGEDASDASDSEILASASNATRASAPAAGNTATGAPRVHLTPIQIAASPIAFSGPRPLPPAFSGPGACDQPGSGCQGQILPAPSEAVFVDKPPAGGCNFPGCALP